MLKFIYSEFIYLNECLNIVCQIIWCSIQTRSHLVLVIYLVTFSFRRMPKLLLHNNCALFSRGHNFTHNSMWQRVDSHEEVHEVPFEIGSSCAVTFTVFSKFCIQTPISLGIFCETKKKNSHILQLVQVGCFGCERTENSPQY